jgi:hypothetical protein
MTIYIHGFGSSGCGGKATIFKDKFSNDILLPSLSYVPTLAINTLEQLIEYFIKEEKKVNLIGSSLGGYYSIYLANKYNLKAVLINPAITPYKTLDKIGMSTNYFDLSNFEVLKEHIEFLKKLNVEKIKNQKNYMVLLQKGDDLLDYKDAVNKLPNAILNIEEGGSHTYDGIQRHFEDIKRFFS